jgi:hypothetical protein
MQELHDFARKPLTNVGCLPFLQQIRHFAGGQLQALIGRDELELHFVALGINPACDREFAEDRQQPTLVLFLSAMHDATIVESSVCTEIACPTMLKKP